MHESKEKSNHRLPLSLPKLKDVAPDDMEDEEEEDDGAAGQQSEEDSENEDLEADLPNALRSTFARLLAH